MANKMPAVVQFAYTLKSLSLPSSCKSLATTVASGYDTYSFKSSIIAVTK